MVTRFKAPKARLNFAEDYFASDDATVTEANNILETLNENLRNYDIPTFGSNMLCRNDIDIIQATIYSRINGKFQRPVQGRDSRLQTECFASWVSYEQRLARHSMYASEFSHADRGQLYKARELLHTWFSDFSISLKDADLSFTPGEHFVSQRGLTSMYQKLKKKENWCVTHDAFDDFVRLCYNNLSLKRCAKSFFKKLSRCEHQDLWWAYSHKRHTGFEVFRHRMQHEVLTIVHGSRGSSVPKNNEKRRFINVEPLCNVILQRLVAEELRAKLLTLGNDLLMGQSHHAEMIADSNLSTIDFSNASDSVITNMVTLLFPKSVSKYLLRYRSPMVLIDGSYYVSHKLSSMGNGFTFEVMTCLLLALARSHGDRNARVYGDDVIIRNEYAESFVRTAACLGFQVNDKKTFINSRFRESCGSFYLDKIGYIVCYDIKWCETIFDYIVTCNKLRRIMDFANEQNLPISIHISNAYNGLCSLARSSLFGPVSQQTYSFDESKWVHNEQSTIWLDSVSLVRVESISSIDIESRWIERHNNHRCKPTDQVVLHAYKSDERFLSLCKDLCYKKHEISLRVLPVEEPVLASPCVRYIYNDQARYAFYLYNGMRAKDVKRNSAKVWYYLCAVLPSGSTIRLRRLRKEPVEHNTNQ